MSGDCPMLITLCGSAADVIHQLSPSRCEASGGGDVRRQARSAARRTEGEIMNQARFSLNALEHTFAADKGHAGAALEFAALEGGIAGAAVQRLRGDHKGF